MVTHHGAWGLGVGQCSTRDEAKIGSCRQLGAIWWSEKGDKEGKRLEHTILDEKSHKMHPNGLPRPGLLVRSFNFLK